MPISEGQKKGFLESIEKVRLDDQSTDAQKLNSFVEIIGNINNLIEDGADIKFLYTTLFENIPEEHQPTIVGYRAFVLDRFADAYNFSGDTDDKGLFLELLGRYASTVKAVTLKTLYLAKSLGFEADLFKEADLVRCNIGNEIKFTEKVDENFLQYIFSVKNLKELNLQGLNIKSEAQDLLAALLLTSKTLKKIEISSSEIDNVDLEKIFEAISQNPTIKNLEIGVIESSKEAVAVIKFLTKNATLKKFSFDAVVLAGEQFEDTDILELEDVFTKTPHDIYEAIKKSIAVCKEARKRLGIEFEDLKHVLHTHWFDDTPPVDQNDLAMAIACMSSVLDSQPKKDEEPVVNHFFLSKEEELVQQEASSANSQEYRGELFSEVPSSLLPEGLLEQFSSLFDNSDDSSKHKADQELAGSTQKGRAVRKPRASRTLTPAQRSEVMEVDLSQGYYTPGAVEDEDFPDTFSKMPEEVQNFYRRTWGQEVSRPARQPESQEVFTIPKRIAPPGLLIQSSEEPRASSAAVASSSRERRIERAPSQPQPSPSQPKAAKNTVNASVTCSIS